MQEQGKRLLVAVALALVVFLGYNQLFGKKTPPPTPGVGSADVAAVQTLGPRPKAGDDLYRGPALPGIVGRYARVPGHRSRAARRTRASR